MRFFRVLALLGVAAGNFCRDRDFRENQGMMFATPWLSAEYATSNGLWLKLAKKGTGIASVSKTEAIDTALYYGWIDGQLDNSTNAIG